MPESNGLVSVVIIFFNESRFLEEAIGSVYAQTYTTWELLLVDDGSSDGSSEIARTYARRDPARVRYLEHTSHGNRGPSASRNLGAASARGEYLAFLDGDDVWLPSRLERGVALMSENPSAQMVYGTSTYWRSWDATTGPDADFVQAHGFQADRLVAPPELLVRFWTHRAAIPCVNSLLVRRKAFEQVGGYEASVRSVWEDQVFLVKFCLQHPVFVSTECWDRYRQHAQSSCARAEASGALAAEQRSFFAWCEDYLGRSAHDSERVRNALRRAQRRAARPRRSLRARADRLLDRLIWSRYALTGWTAR